MSGIDTNMPGKPEAVYDVADWLGSLKRTMDAAGSRTRGNGARSEIAWQGEGGDAYRDFNGDVKKAAHEIEDRASDAQDKVRSYAQQLTWRQDDLEAARARATAGGLTVAGTVIQPPPAAVPPPDLPAGSTEDEAEEWDRDVAAYERAAAKVRLYDELLGDVRRTFDDLDSWVTEHLGDLERSLSNPFKAAAIVGGLAGLGLAIPENVFKDRAARAQAASIAARDELARSRSRNPAVRSGSKPPSARSLANASKPGTRASRLAGLADDAGRAAKLLARGGVVTAVVLGGYEIAKGESPSGVAVETVAGLAAGAGVAVLVGAGVITAPVWGTIAIGVGAGVAATAAAGWAYEQFVPQETREKIDEGLKDAWDATGGKIADGVGDAWDSVFG